jgi:hypothetical protein
MAWTRLSACSVDKKYFGAVTFIPMENSDARYLTPSQSCRLNYRANNRIMFEKSYDVDKNLALIGDKKLFWCIDFSYSGK